MCDFLYKSLWNISRCKTDERDTITNVGRSASKVPYTLVMFSWNLNFLDEFSKKILKYQITRNSVRWEPSCSVGADGQTDVVDFRNFANAPNKREEQRTGVVSGRTDGQLCWSRGKELREQGYSLDRTAEATDSSLLRNV